MRKQTGFLLTGLAGLALWGCGGGGTPSSPSGDPLTRGRAALNQVATGAAPSDTQTFLSILDEFSLALQQNPNSPDAHFGAALCLAGQIGDELDNVNVTSSSSGSNGGGVPAAGKAAKRDDSVPPTTGIGGPPTLPAPPVAGDIPPAPPGHSLPVKPLPPRHQLGLLWNLDSSLANPYALLNMLAPLSDLQHGLIPYYGYPYDTTDITRRQKLLTDLNTVEQHLQAVEANPNFSTTLPDPNRNGQMVTVGLPEVFLFDAYVNSLRTEVALSLAYIRDPGSFQMVPTPVPLTGTAPAPPAPPVFAVGGAKRDSAVNPPLTVFQGLDKNGDGKLTPDEYLPPSPYLTLRDASYLKTAQQAMQTLVDRETKGISGVLARPTNGVFLVSNTPEVQKILTEVRDHVLPLIQQAATGPVTLELPHYQPLIAATSLNAAPAPFTKPGVFNLQPDYISSPGSPGPPVPPVFTAEKVTINLAVWFANPPADLKKFAPTYTLDAAGFLNFDQTVYPDPTFGGLYPDGLPRDLIF
jgi:hypothetical protein